jgi:DNA replication protein DnaC
MNNAIKLPSALANHLTNPGDIEWWSAREERLRVERAAHAEELGAFLDRQPQTKSCSVHPDVTQSLLREHSSPNNAKYEQCPKCVQSAEEKRRAQFLHDAGVPANLLHCSLDNWIPRNAAEVAHLAKVRAFAKARRGFLVMLGEVGTGKSHLSIGLMAGFNSPRLINQNTLLSELRRTYRDPKAADPIRAYQRADLLVLDEMGLSAGGKDELPALHEILNYRFGEFLPSILLGNISTDQLREILGERLVDRLTESAFAILTLAGPSHRAESRKRYFPES